MGKRTGEPGTGNREGDFNYYTVTRLNPQQRSLLETLELVELADDNAIEKQISPR
jgi:hypothetical protein